MKTSRSSSVSCEFVVAITLRRRCRGLLGQGFAASSYYWRQRSQLPRRSAALGVDCVLFAGPVEMRLISGPPALQALMPSSAASRDPLWPLDSAGSLRHWLGDQSVRWCEQDESFAAHRAIAMLELEAGADYKALTQRHWVAKAAYQSAEGRPRVEEAEQALQGGEKAVAGLRAYANAGSDADTAEVR